MYCLQADYYHEGLEGESVIVPVSIRNSRGEVIRDSSDGYPAPLISDPVQDGEGTAFTIIEAPQDAAYIQLEESDIGTGFLRMWGFQLTFGAASKPWTNDVATSGSITVAFDTRTPTVHRGLKAVMGYKRMLDGGAVADEPAGTLVEAKSPGQERAGCAVV